MQGICAGGCRHWVWRWYNMHRSCSNSCRKVISVWLCNWYFELQLTWCIQYLLLLGLLVDSTTTQVSGRRVCRLISFFLLMIDTYVVVLACVAFNYIINLFLPLCLHLHLHYRVLLLRMNIRLCLKLLLVIVLACIALVYLILSHQVLQKLFKGW